MVQLLIEKDGPPIPARNPGGAPPKEHYAFEAIPIGSSARIPRGESMVRKKLSEHKKTHPEHKFVVRPITPTMTRVWRTA